MKFRELKLRRDPQCPICGDHPTIKELIDYEMFCGITPKAAAPQANPDEVTVHEMKKALDNPRFGSKVIDVREADEYEIANADDGGSPVQFRFAPVFDLTSCFW